MKAAVYKLFGWKTPEQKETQDIELEASTGEKDKLVTSRTSVAEIYDYDRPKKTTCWPAWLSRAWCSKCCKRENTEENRRTATLNL